MHLHAREVTVPLSKNKAPVRVVAPVPTHMRERLAACGWNRADEGAEGVAAAHTTHAVP
jgi:tRNA pseudouridine32 synthase/23S rRNA pseudouridine746 synthase